MVAHFTVQAATVLHSGLLHNLLRSPISFYDTNPIGRVLNRLGRDIDVVDTNLPMVSANILNTFLTIIGNIIIICIATPIFVAIIVPVFGLYIFIQRLYVATVRQLRRLDSATRSPIYSHFQETIQGITSIRAYKVEDIFLHEAEYRLDTNNRAYIPSQGAFRWIGVVLFLVGNVITFAAALLAVAARDTLSASLAGLAINNSLSITRSMTMWVNMASGLETSIVSVERIKEYSETPTEASWESEPGRKPKKDWPQEGNIEFDHYDLRYRPGLDLVLSGITCNIQKNEKIGIVGRTGAGKSSLTLALFRLIEAAGGVIKIDGIDIAKIGLHDLRSRLTIIPQDPVLFTGSLRLNLDPFETCTDEQLWRALELAHLKPFVAGLQGTLQYKIAEGGENLSVGQRQLICLARALLRHTKVLILDEATAAVDLETDDFIQQTITKQFENCTVITIAHRLNTILDSSRVMVLDRGNIVEFAPPNDLLADPKSIFHSMARDAGLLANSE